MKTFNQFINEDRAGEKAFFQNHEKTIRDAMKKGWSVAKMAKKFGQHERTIRESIAWVKDKDAGIVRKQTSGMEIYEAKGKLEIHVGGDRYDGGVVVAVYSNGKEVENLLMGGDEDYTLDKKTYGNYGSYAKAIEKKYKAKAKRVSI